MNEENNQTPEQKNDFSTNSDGKPFFIDDHLKNISHILNNTTSPKKMKRVYKIFNYILKNAPINLYQLAKELEINYTSVNQTIKELEFTGLIQIRVILNDQNRAEKIIIIPEEILGEIKK